MGKEMLHRVWANVVKSVQESKKASLEDVGGALPIVVPLHQTL
jgi:hypothetical protein